jgi:hypothetical protein
MFDPSLGDLNEAQIIINQTLFHDINASNNMDIPANVTFNGYGNLSLILPDKSILNAESVINWTESLASRTNLDLNESTSKTQSFSFDESQNEMFVASSPNETLLLPLVAAAHGSHNAEGAFTFSYALKSRASICIIYDYSETKSQNMGGRD